MQLALNRKSGGREVGDILGPPRGNGTSLISLIEAEQAKTWTLTRSAPDWHSHLLAFSQGFLNSLAA